MIARPLHTTPCTSAAATFAAGRVMIQETTVKPTPRFPVAARFAAMLFAAAFALSACSSNSGSSPSATTGGGASAPESSGSAAASASEKPERATIKLGLAQPIFSYTPIYVAKAKGFWEDENLDVQITIFNSSTENQQALLGDVIDVGGGGYTEPMTITAQGKQTVIFGFVQGALPYRLMTKGDITDINQLDGKTLAVSKIGALSDQITRIALNEKGFDPNKAKYQQAGGSPSRLAALQSGAVDGALLDSPSYQLAEKAGANVLINVAAELPGFPYEVLYAKKEAIDAKHDVFLRFMRGFIKGAQYATDPANEDDVLKIVADATGQKADDLKLAYDETIKDFPPTGAMKLDGIEKALAGTQKFGDIPGIDKVTAQDLYYPDLQQEAAQSLGK
jgi:NitT/TauT family transport system substrate-binding protein